MTNSIAEKVGSLGHRLPPVSAPAGSYVGTVRVRNLLYVSGQISLQDGKPAFLGRLGAEFDVEQGQQAARAAGLGVLAQIAAATQDRLTAVRRVAKLSVFVASAPDFARQPDVANGASDLMVAVFGDKGKHTRSTVGVAALPADAAVEVEGLFEIS